MYACIIVIHLSTSILRRCRYSTRCVCEAAEVFRVRPISAAVGARTPDRVGVEAVAVHEWNQSIQGSRSYFLNLRILAAYIHTYICTYIQSISCVLIRDLVEYYDSMSFAAGDVIDYLRLN